MDTLLLNANGMPMSQIPLSVIPWNKALHKLYLGKAKVIKEYDEWEVRSQNLTIKVPSIIIMTHQKKWVKQVKYSHSNILLRDNFTCQLQITSRCKEVQGKVKIDQLTQDHIVPRSQGGKTNWTNICLACRECNSTKGNDASIVPKVMPREPNYYEILKKKKTLPITIRDEDWKFYIDWPDHLITVQAQPTGNPTIVEDVFEMDDDEE